MVGMQTLGLTSKPQPTDNIFKRLLWPSIENLYDVDLIGQQGFWLCVLVGVISGIMLVFIGMPWMGLFIAVTYFFGGCGVRQRSIAAAATIFTLYLLNFLVSLYLGQRANPILPIIALMLLFANIRGTVLAHGWMNAPEPGEDPTLPERSATTLPDRFANKLPAILWPKVRYVFFVFAVIFVILTIIGVVYSARIRHQQSVYDEPPSATLDAR